MLLTTKLFVPPLHDLRVSRARLHDQLDAGLNARLTLVSAPAGFGKSTLLAEWIGAYAGRHPQARALPAFAWLSLDEQDNDPVRFYTHMLAALHQADETLGSDLPTLALAPQLPSGETLMSALINDAARRETPLVLVCDDYNAIENSGIHQAIIFLIDHMPACLHLVLATRANPVFPLARWRLRRMLCEVREQDLRFRPDEIQAFLASALGVTLDQAEIAAIQQRTEGWIGALQLAALTLQGSTDIHTLLAKLSGSHTYIVDYLVEEVLNRQPPAIQRFLLQTSILDRMAGELCSAVTGVAEGEAILRELHRQNLFTIALDEEQYWFRYHQLFAEMLRARLRRSGVDTAQLYASASQWSEENGWLAEAVHYALAARDQQRVAQLVERHYWGMLQRSEFVQLQSWLQCLPPDLIRRHAALSLASAWTLYPSYRIAELDAHLDNAERALAAAEQPAADAATVQRMRAELAALRASNAFVSGNLQCAIERAERAVTCAEGQQPPIFCVNAITLGFSYYYAGQLDRSYTWCKTGHACAIEAGLPYLAAESLNILMIYLDRTAQLEEIDAVTRRILAAAAEGNAMATYLSMTAHFWRARLLLEWFQLAEAAEHAGLAHKLAVRLGIHDMVIETQMALVFVCQAQGNWPAAHSHLLQVRELSRQTTDFIGGWLAALEARTWLIQGEPGPAAAAIQAAGLSPHNEVSAGNDGEAAALVRLLYAEGKLDEALELAERVRTVAAAIPRTDRLMEMLSFRALVRWQQGERTSALAALDEAMTLAKGNRFLYTYWSLPAPMEDLLAAYLDQQAADSFGAEMARDLLRLRRQAPVVTLAASPREPAPPPALAEPLSEREREVLALVAQGLSDRAIAERLIIAPGTVKRHLNNLYGKLGVHSRTQALARAHEAGLLSEV